jgi:hypothetical protein
MPRLYVDFDSAQFLSIDLGPVADAGRVGSSALGDFSRVIAVAALSNRKHGHA